MKYAFLTTLIPKEYEKPFYDYSKGIMQDAANALQWNLYHGFSQNIGEEIPVFNILPVGSFPQYCRKTMIPEFTFCKAGINIGFCNVKFFRNLDKAQNAYKVLKQWCEQEKDEKTLFVYTISKPFVDAVYRVKKSFPELKVCAIVADIPEMSNLSNGNHLIQKLYVKQQSEMIYKKKTCIDKYVLLTKHMADYMRITQPFHIMEGIASEPGQNENQDESDIKFESNKSILYTGTLHQKFGILHLLDAFGMIRDENYRLIICGVGDSEEMIKRASEDDKRIIFLGQKTREEVLRLQQQATVLVNPRQNNEEFTKYSFPSKTMEYLASGKPVIAYKLDGIPDEYDSYINYPDESTAESLANKLLNICGLTEMERSVIGEKGRNYVLENKNPLIQTKKILEFVTDTEG